MKIEPPSHPISSFKIVVLLSYISIASASAAIITPALPIIEKQFALSHGALEWVVTIFLIGYVVGQLIYGPLANRFGRLNALRTGLILNLFGIVICLLSSWSNSFALLLIGRCITALGSAAGLACTFMLIHDLLSEERAKHILSFAIVSFTLGVGAAVTLGGIMTEYLNWSSIFWLLLIHGIIMLANTWLFPETLIQRQDLHIIRLVKAYAKILKNKFFVIYSLVLGITAIISYCYSAAAPVISQQEFHLTPSEYGYWNLINVIGMFVGSIVARILLHKLDEVIKVIYIALFGFLLCIVSLLWLHISEHPIALWFFITTMGLYIFGSLFFPCGAHYAMLATEDKANGSSMMSFINMGSATVSVMVMGYLPFHSMTAFIVMLTATWLIITILAIYAHHSTFKSNLRLI